MCVGGGEAGALGHQHCNAFCGASIVTLFAAQHCSSLCLQSEGGEGCGDSIAPERGSYLG